MATEKDIGIVLRLVPFSETSCIVTLFTRGAGKIGALAKGARRPKSPFEAALDLLAVCRVVFIHRSSASLDLLTEAKLERRFRSASRDLSRLYAGYYVAELLQELTSEADPHSGLFDEASRVLEALDRNGEVTREVLRFELYALRVLGHLPLLDRCVECGRKDIGERRIAFGQLVGGVLCPSCRKGKRQVISIRAEVIELLRQFADNSKDRWRDIPIDRGSWGELRAVLNHYLSQIMGRRPRMHAYASMFLPDE